MSKNHVAVMSVVSGSMSVAQASREFGISRQHVYRLVARYRAEGPEGLEPRSRAPRSHPNPASSPCATTAPPHALGVGAAHAGISTVITLDATTVTVIDPTTGQILSTHHIDPDRRYWPNTQRPPGRWPKHDP
nr:helix-turn-helix domain-containing protein [Propionibacterium freudenreichii]